MIDSIKARLPVAALTEAMRCDGYSVGQTDTGMAEYCRFLALLAEVGGTLRPTKLGDEVLHRHINMASFDDDCLKIVGARITHTPHAGETPELTAVWLHTRQVTLNMFGIDPEAVCNDNATQSLTGDSVDAAAICSVTVGNAAICSVTVENAAICSVTRASQAA
jgi:hypothetical protein